MTKFERIDNERYEEIICWVKLYSDYGTCLSDIPHYARSLQERTKGKTFKVWGNKL